MQSLKSAGKIHPLVAVAAASVIIVSLVGVAAMTGMLPSSDSTTKAESTAGIAVPNPEKRVAAANRGTAEATRAKSPASSPARGSAAQHACDKCGKVIGLRAIEQASKPSGIGAVAGAVVGGVIGNQVGGGTGKTLATVAGAVGGGYAGNEIEKRTTKTLRHEVDVQMEDGTRQSFSYDAQPDWQAGDKVKVVGGALQRR